jgi:lipopolysaccharide export LptBFGC system permease protein LptF
MIYANWNLAFPLFVAALPVLAFGDGRIRRAMRVPMVALGFCAIYFFCYFSFFSPESAQDHSGLSRTLLYVTPTLLLVAVTTFANAGTAGEETASET